MVMMVVMPVVMGVAVGVMMPVIMPVLMGVIMVMPMVVPMHLGFAFGTSANSAHYATSKSLIRISSPPCGISFPPPQSGQGSRRAWISTSFIQS